MRFTTLLNYLLTDWWCSACFCLVTWWFNSRFLLQHFYMGNWWIWTCIDYHPCNTSKPTDQVLSSPAKLVTFALNIIVMTVSRHTYNFKYKYSNLFSLIKNCFNTKFSLGLIINATSTCVYYSPILSNFRYKYTRT